MIGIARSRAAAVFALSGKQNIRRKWQILIRVVFNAMDLGIDVEIDERENIE